MAHESDCCSAGKPWFVLACSGGSNVGQMTNEIAKELNEAGDAKFFCLAGVGGHIDGMVEKVKGAEGVLVIDGCPVGCGKHCMDAADLTGYEHLVVTELGIEKEQGYDLKACDREKVLSAARQKLRDRA